jgi:hypothetical protein
VTIHIYLALDPETDRVLAQDTFILRTDLPPGPRGEGWPIREVDIPLETWTTMLEAGFDPVTQDRLHKEWWAIPE